MRVNRFIAQATGLSRRHADQAITGGRVLINNRAAALGATVDPNDHVTLDGQLITAAAKHLTIMLNKPVGYVCSRDGQGSPTVYDLLPAEYHRLKPVGRLDKDSSGLLLLTDDGQLADQLTHPRHGKTKIYEVGLDKSLTGTDQTKLEQGVRLDDGPSELSLKRLDETGKNWRITMTEGRNRQIRRSFAALGYQVVGLHRIKFGDYTLRTLPSGKFQIIA